MNAATYPSGLRYLFILGATGSFVTGVGAIFFPGVIVSLSGLSPQAIPAMQQAGAFALGSFVAALMCLRIADWNQVRITTVSTFVIFLLTTVGAFYYVVLQGVATPALIFILVFAIVMTLGFGFYSYRAVQRA